MKSIIVITLIFALAVLGIYFIVNPMDVFDLIIRS